MTKEDAAPPRQRLLVGTWGWDYDRWTGAYYPEELPPEWRLAYYCNDHRGVLVPADHWSGAPAVKLGDVVEEIDAYCSVIVELPPRGLPELDLQSTALLELLQPLEERLRAICWRPAFGISVRSMEDAARLAAVRPLVLDYRDGHPQRGALHELRAEAGASRLWRPQEEREPGAAGRFLLALAKRPDLATLRSAIERLSEWMGRERYAGLFLAPTPDAPDLAKQCRILAELLEI